MSRKTTWALTRDGIPYSIRLYDGETTIGRVDICTIPIISPFCSRMHCKIFLDDTGNIILEDTSSNGTFVNEQKVVNDRISLKANDKIGIGVYNLTSEELLKDYHHVYKLYNIDYADSENSMAINNNHKSENNKIKNSNSKRKIKQKRENDIHNTNNIISPYNKIVTRSYLRKQKSTTD